MQDTEILEREGAAAALPYERPAEAELAGNGALAESESLGLREGYDISVMAHEFNIFTLRNFMDREMITVPVFQRGFVWDKPRASRFIESVALGLPVPEIFLYQFHPNKWGVVDGQQRLLSVYFFSRGRFPRPKESAEISRLMRRSNALPEGKWSDNRLFSDFALDLRSRDSEKRGLLNGKRYQELGAHIERKTLRAVVIRQHAPEGDRAAFEIFDRLNTGGVHLSPQQIRTCIYRSNFLDAVYDLNNAPEWRSLIGGGPLSKNQADAENILRAFAMLEDGDNYGPAMRRFLNDFCRKKKGATDHEVNFLRELFAGFLRACGGKKKVFHRNNKFSPALFESVFVASLRECREQKRMPKGELDSDAVSKLANNPEFEKAARQSSNTKSKVRARLDTARFHIAPL